MDSDVEVNEHLSEAEIKKLTKYAEKKTIVAEGSLKHFSMRGAGTQSEFNLKEISQFIQGIQPIDAVVSKYNKEVLKFGSFRRLLNNKYLECSEMEAYTRHLINENGSKLFFLNTYDSKLILKGKIDDCRKFLKADFKTGFLTFLHDKDHWRFCAFIYNSRTLIYMDPLSNDVGLFEANEFKKNFIAFLTKRDTFLKAEQKLNVEKITIKYPFHTTQNDWWNCGVFCLKVSFSKHFFNK